MRPDHDPAAPLPTIPVAEAIERLESILGAGPARAVLATDGDGTLWTQDIGEALFEAVLARGMVSEPARAALRAEAEAHAVPVDPRADATTVARALWDAYLAHRYPEDRMCAAMAWCTAGIAPSAMLDFSRELLARDFVLRDRFIEEALAIVRFAAARSVPTFLVSASPRAVVEAAAEIVREVAGLDRLEVIAMTPAVEGGLLAPEIEGIWPYGEGKAAALRELLGTESFVACALGDNRFDVPMLRAARLPLAVRAKPALLRVAGEVPGLRQLVS